MSSPSSTNLQAAALAVHTTKSTSASMIDEEGWQVVVPRARYKRSTTSAQTTQVDTIMSQKGPGANTFQKSGRNNTGNKKNAGGRGEANRGGRGDKSAGVDLKGINKVQNTAKGFGGEMKRTFAAPSQPLAGSTKTWSQIAMQVEPEESTIESIDNSARLILAPVVQAHPSIQLDSQTGLVMSGSEASFSDKEVVDLTSPPISLSVQVPDDDVPHESVLVDVAEATVLVEAVSVDDEDHKNEAVKLTRPSSLPSSAEAGPEERTIIETAAISQSLQRRSTEITISGSSVVIECENLDYGMSTVEEANSVRKNASEGGAEGNIDAAKRRLSPPFQWNHGVVPYGAVAVVPAVTTWAVTMTLFTHGRILHPQLYSFPHDVEMEQIYQVATPTTTTGTHSKLNPYAREFLPSYITDQSSHSHYFKPW